MRLATRYPTLQEAINATPPGGTLTVPAGTYRTGGLMIDKPMTITGAGTIQSSGPVNVLVSVRASGVTISELVLDAVNAKVGVFLAQGTSGCVVENLTITLPVDAPYGAVPCAIGIQAYSACADTYGGGRNDTLTFAQPTNLSQSHVIQNNTIYHGTHGISLFGARTCQVLNNHCEGQTHRSIILSPVAHANQVKNNQCIDFGSTAIHIAWGSCGNIITGNTGHTSVSMIEGNGIKAYYGCDDNEIRDNDFTGALHACYRVALGCKRNTFIGNTARSSGLGFEIESYIDQTSDYMGLDQHQPTNPPTTEGNQVTGNTWIDCTYEGRMAARSGFPLVDNIAASNQATGCGPVLNVS